MRKLRASRVLELNGDHRAVQALKAAFDAGDREKAAHLAKILHTLAEMMAGCEIEDPASFVGLVSELF
jgi:HSP90 family molecular chaperone